MAKKLNMHVYDYIMNDQFLLFVGICLVGAISHYFWQYYLDKRLNLLKNSPAEASSIDEKRDVNIYLAILPLLPIITIIFERVFTHLSLPLWSISSICILISFMIDEKLNTFTLKEQVGFFKKRK